MNDERTLGLIVANGALPSAEIIASLLVASPYVLAADGGADKLLELGVLPDAVLGDLDSVSADLPSSIKRVFRPDQNYTDLDKAVAYLRELGYTAIWIIGMSGDRLDHTFGALSVLLKHGRYVDLLLVDNVGTARLIVETVKMEVTIGQIVSLLPLGPVPSITTTGLEWNLANEPLSPGVRDGISNRAIAKQVTIIAPAGDLIVYVHNA